MSELEDEQRRVMIQLYKAKFHVNLQNNSDITVQFVNSRKSDALLFAIFD